MDSKEIKGVLDEHRKWLEGVGGVKADFNDADLRGADLRDAGIGGAKIDEHPLSILKHQHGKVTAFKFLDSDLISPFEHFQYEIGKSYTTDEFDSDKRVLCGKGFNVATKDWCKRSMCDKHIFVEVSFKAKDIVAIPYASEGKFRVKAMTIEKVVT